MPRSAPALAIDFGTSNSAVALVGSLAGSEVRLVSLEDGQPTMPTAVFYRADTPTRQIEADRLYGRAAVAAYVAGADGRLMRSMKSILGSTLLDQRTDIGAGRAVAYRDVVTGFLKQLKTRAEAEAGQSVNRLVLGRPVHFVDDDPGRDAQAQTALEVAARQIGFEQVQFQFEPIAAALDHESRINQEQRVLVADIGGGTSDFSVVRVGPARRGRLDRKDDILANHGVHVAGTDFDRQLSLATILPLLGHRARRSTRAGMTAAADAPELPSGIYFDLATWHLINTVYAPARLAEVRAIKSWFADTRHHARLIATLEQHLGHTLAAAAERAKIDVATGGQAAVDLDLLENGLSIAVDEAEASAAIEADLQRIVDAAGETVRMAGLQPEAIDVLYFTGGSTGLSPLVQRIASRFARAESVRGDRYASVAQGLGLHAAAVYGLAGSG